MKLLKEPKIIAIQSQKGGAGKSTLIVNLATYAVECGYKVAILDFDKQGSTLYWGAQRALLDNVPQGQPSIAKMDLATLKSSTSGSSKIDDLQAAGFNMIFLDTRGSDEALNDEIIAYADAVIVPIAPAMFDFESAKATLRRLIQRQKPYTLVWCRIPKINANTPKKIADFMRQLPDIVQTHVQRAETVIGDREAVRDALNQGYGITEFSPNSKAAKECRDLFHELHKQLLAPLEDYQVAA